MMLVAPNPLGSNDTSRGLSHLLDLAAHPAFRFANIEFHFRSRSNDDVS